MVVRQSQAKYGAYKIAKSALLAMSSPGHRDPHPLFFVLTSAVMGLARASCNLLPESRWRARRFRVAN